MIICIGSACGSGGHEIGKLLAQKLGYSYYDTEQNDSIAAETAKDGTLPVVSDLGDNASVGETTALIEQQAQDRKNLILAAAAKGSCVIAASCADYFIQEAGMDRLSIFITAPFMDRIDRQMSLTGKDRMQAATAIKKENIQRESMYNLTTGGKWGDPSNYDLCINSSSAGIEAAADALAGLIKAKI